MRCRATTTPPPISSAAISPPAAPTRPRSSTIAASVTYGELARRVDRAANALRRLGIEPEQRVMLCLLDTIDFPVAFLGAIKAGIVPVPVNTLLTPADYQFMLADSRARALIVSDALYDRLAPVLARLPDAAPRHHRRRRGRERASPLHCASRRVGGSGQGGAHHPRRRMLLALFLGLDRHAQGGGASPVALDPDRRALRQARARASVEDDLVYSAAKLFFAYGLGNSLTFPMAVGATSLLLAERLTPAVVSRILAQQRPTIFYGVPTLYAAMLASADLPQRGAVALRRCVSAGEALPEEIGRRWSERFGVEILDGLGSTEMLHIFLSNRPGEVRYGSSGVPVPGYAATARRRGGPPHARRRDRRAPRRGSDQRRAVLEQPRALAHDISGAMDRSGDKYVCDADGYYTYCGRADDMMKVGGIWVSPFEVEAALMTHESVLEAAVVGHEDEHQLLKPRAFVVLRPGAPPSDALAAELQQHVKSRLAPYKYPRWIEFAAELPKTATGKIQRFKLRAQG